MKTEEEIKEELQFQMKQSFLDHDLNVCNRERGAFVDGFISALSWVLGGMNE